MVAAAIAVAHRPETAEVPPLDASKFTGEVPHDLAEWWTGDYVLDFVEPSEGEGGSERAIAAAVLELDGRPDVEVAAAGPYSEGEHLFRLHTDPSSWNRVLADLMRSSLIEGIEPELIYAIDLPDAAPIQTLDDSPPEPAKPPRFDPNDPMFRYQWHMEQIRAPEAWARSQSGTGAVVAVIDTGVAWRNDSASGARRLPDLAETKFTKGKSFIAGVPDGLDDHAHGSHVAGTIAQSTNNGVGVTGVAHKATIMPLKVLSKDGRGSVPGIADAIRYAADQGAHVINMSLGGPLPSHVLAKAIEYAHSKGVTTVCAAGNESRSRVGYPAANQYAVAVSATNFSRELSFYSNWGVHIDVAAPGGDTRSDKNGDGKPDGVLQNTIAIKNPAANDYLWFQGTSMASPHAAGVAALIVGEGVTNPDEVERILKETAAHPQNQDWDKFFGAGIVDAAAAVEGARKHYRSERAGLLLLTLFGLGGLGVGARRRWLAGAGTVGVAALASGALSVPLAYQFGTLLGGVGALGSPWFLSALLPLTLTILTMSWRAFRPILQGLNAGYAALLLHGAVVLPTLLAGVPGGPAVDRLWLLANAVVAGWLAWRLSVTPGAVRALARPRTS